MNQLPVKYLVVSSSTVEENGITWYKPVTTGPTGRVLDRATKLMFGKNVITNFALTV